MQSDLQKALWTLKTHTQKSLKATSLLTIKIQPPKILNYHNTVF